MSPNKSTRRPVVNPEPIARIGQAERTRAAILDAAFEFLWSRPFRDMTVNALMEQIPQGRTAFYKYFDDIHGVMAALLKNLESEILEGAGTWLSDDGDPVALLYESLAAEVQSRERAYNCGPGTRPDRSLRSPPGRDRAQSG
jgi:AcrR family transcriptional regulator